MQEFPILTRCGRVAELLQIPRKDPDESTIAPIGEGVVEIRFQLRR